VAQVHPSLLLVSDDARYVSVVRTNLEKTGIQSCVSGCCKDAKTLLRDATFDAILLADNNGCCHFAWACPLRNRIEGRYVPLLVIPDEKSSPTTDSNVASNFAIRLSEFLRRFNVSTKGHWLELRGITLDAICDKVTQRGKPIHLSPIEFRLLAYFMTHPDRVLTPQRLFSAVWRRNSNPGRTVAMHIAQLRRALADRNTNSLIRTVRGSGYVFRSSGSERAGQFATSSTPLKYAPLSVRPRPRRQRASGLRALRPNEHTLLGLLALNPSITFSRECIAGLIWGRADVDLRTVDATVSRVREVFLQRTLPNPVRGVIGRGYQINDSSIDQAALVLAGTEPSNRYKASLTGSQLQRRNRSSLPDVRQRRSIGHPGLD